MAGPRLRALELPDAVAAHRLCAQPGAARFGLELPEGGLDGWKRKLLELPHERSSVIGAFDGDRALLGVGWLEGRIRARERHVARLWVAVDGSARRCGLGSALAGALLEAADRWWGYLRVEADVRADDVAGLALAARVGLEVEARKRGAVLEDGALIDVLQLARIRDGFALPSELAPPPVVVPPGAPVLAGRLRIRPHRPDDAAEIARLSGEESSMEGTLATPFQSERKWRERLSGMDASVRGLVAVIDGRVAGSAALFADGGPLRAHAAGFGIQVASGFQGRGVGDALTGALIELWERMPGPRRVQLEVFADNARAQALYRKHGFELEGRARYSGFRRGTYADSWIMGRLRAR